MKNNNSHVVTSRQKINAKARGYSFYIDDDVWVLDKNVSVYLSTFKSNLGSELYTGFIKALAFYASNHSASHTSNIADRFRHMIQTTGSNAITEVSLINYRASLDEKSEWYLGVIRGFLRKWYRLGYVGVSNDVINLLKSWRIRGNRKGDAVKRRDPNAGPLTDIELLAFNEGVITAFEKDLISVTELALCLTMSNTGRRPIQISHLKVVDIAKGQNQKGEPSYLINIPRAKQRGKFRETFRAFAISQELWVILSAQAKYAVASVEEALGFELQDIDRQKVPLFPDIEFLSLVKSPSEFRALMVTDKAHIASARITRAIQEVVDATQIKSERTGKTLSINSRRFRYTTGTRASREGFGKLVIAELLDHSDTQNAEVYTKSLPEFVAKLDKAVGLQMAQYAQAFSGVLVDDERDATRGNDPSSRLRADSGEPIGSCGEHGFCAVNVPIPCYTCIHFQPWLDGPHEDVYSSLIDERSKLLELTGDKRVSSALDRTIAAVAQVIQGCQERQAELVEQGGIGCG